MSRDLGDRQAHDLLDKCPQPLQIGCAGGAHLRASRPSQLGPALILRLPNHFYADVDVDALRFGRETGQIAEAIITHLNGLMGAKVTVSLQIEAHVPDGIPESVQRTVSENCRTLKIHFELEQR